MHSEAHEFLRRTLLTEEAFQRHKLRVLEIGSRNVNGTPRELFVEADQYTGIDIEPGDGVDIVADGATWEPDGKYDIAICMEVFEHTLAWPMIVLTMGKALKKGGLAIITAATDPRAPHSAVDGWDVREGEFYENVPPEALRTTMQAAGFDDITVTTHPRGDVYGKAINRHE